MKLQDQVALVTGASSGIGRALSKELAQQGCTVGLLARRSELLESLAQEITDAGGKAAFEVADVGNREQVRSAVERITQELGPITLLVANAGMSLNVTLEPFNVEDIEQVYRVNFFGAIYAIDAVLPGMLERGQGHLALVSSLGSYKGMPSKQAYTSSKAALNNFAEGLRIQLREHGVGVTTICPGFVRTPLTAHLPKMLWVMEPEVAARRMVRAIRRQKKVYNFPRRTTFLMKMTRWIPDWLLARSTRKYLRREEVE